MKHQLARLLWWLSMKLGMLATWLEPRAEKTPEEIGRECAEGMIAVGQLLGGFRRGFNEGLGVGPRLAGDRPPASPRAAQD